MAGGFRRAKPFGRPAVHTGETQPLYRDGLTLRRADGTIFPYRACSWFAAFHRFARGEDITGQLDDWVRRGFTVGRVFALFDAHGIGKASGTGECSPRTVATFYPTVAAFTALCASRGFFVSWVYCADCDPRDDGTGGLMPDRATVQAHIDAMDATLAGHWNVLRQGANEPFKNLRDVATYRFRRDGTQPLDFGIETADRGTARIPVADWVGKHDHRRDDFQFPRDARSYDEFCHGFSWELTDEERAEHPEWAEEFEGTHTPVTGDEPMGAAEFPRSGSRSSDPARFRELGAAGTMLGAGVLFHSDDGIAARPLGPVQEACAAQFIRGCRFVPSACQLSGYQRGGEHGGAGVGNMPIEHFDLGEGHLPAALRSFCKLGPDGAEYCIRIHPEGATLARDGWRITEEPDLGLVRLVR